MREKIGFDSLASIILISQVTADITRDLSSARDVTALTTRHSCDADQVGESPLPINHRKRGLAFRALG